MIDRPSHIRVEAGRLSRLGVILSAALAVSACANGQGDGIFNFGPLTQSAETKPPADMDPAQAVAHYGSLYATDPRDKTNALRYAKALRATDDDKRAFSVLRSASVYHNDDPEFLSAYGRAALANGQASAAVDILARADDPTRPDWRTVSARGTAYARLGKYGDAVKQFERALKLAPGNPSAMNNLAMAKAATGNLTGAESLLRQATIMPILDPKVKQNLAIVLRLQGRQEEAEKLNTDAPSAVAMRQTVSPARSRGLDATQMARVK